MIRAALIASAFGLVLVGEPALAQQSAGPGYGPTDEVTVEVGRLKVEQLRPGQPPGRMSLSMPVNYSDLDLRSWRGAHELRARVREASADVCERLKEFYPDFGDSDASCYRATARLGLARADRAIERARYSDRYYASYRPY